MKKLILLAVIAIAAIGLSSCDDSVLSKSSARKAIKKEAMFADDYAVGKFNIGYYEVTDADLVKLNQLKAAGMITFTTEKIVEKATRSNYNYWSGITYYTVDIEHTFANVQLTEDGSKLVVDNPTTLRKDLVNDFKANENYEEVMPDYMNATGGVVEEVTEVVETPVVEDIDAVEVIEEDFDDDDTVAVVAQPAPKKAAPAADNKNAAYEAACGKVNITEVYVLLGRYSLEKVKEILCTEDMAKNGVGTCTAIITFKDKTPFGYVFAAPKEGYLESVEVSFIHYEDLGWTVSKFDF